ncbi:MAG TPA: HAD family hydrolase [Rhabdochlamydiaceae bacterium]
MRKHKGWIALDIDGTITDDTHCVPRAVVDYLHSLQEQGWQVMFITGRSLSFAAHALHVFEFPYYLAVQNGADILHMPSKRLVARYYLDHQVIPEMKKLYAEIPEDFIVYAGYERGDFCYYRPKKFSSHLLAHLHKIMPLSNEPWKEVNTFIFPSEETFPLIKCLGKKTEMEKVAQELQSMPHVACTLIRDPLDHDRIYLNLVTHEKATKGKALLCAMEEYAEKGAVIAAGDDLNDISMLEVADFKIVMQNAPVQMHSLAHFLAKKGNEMGIIEALEKGTAQCQMR